MGRMSLMGPMFKKCAKPARSPLDRIVHPVYCSNSTTVLCV